MAYQDGGGLLENLLELEAPPQYRSSERARTSGEDYVVLVFRNAFGETDVLRCGQEVVDSRGLSNDFWRELRRKQREPIAFFRNVNGQLFDDLLDRLNPYASYGRLDVEEVLYRRE